MGQWEELDVRWQREAEAILTGVKEWRQQHPRATLREIEEAVDERLNAARAHLLEELALTSRAADLQDKQLGERPRCPTCGTVLEPRGKQRRSVQVHGGHTLNLERDYAGCSACQTGLFPPG